MSAPGIPPSGTVTFLRTDLEGSTRLAQRYGPRWDAVLARHHVLVRSAIRAHHGHEVRTEGDAFLAAFADASGAAAVGVAITRAMADEPWPESPPLRVRIGLHAASAYRSGDDYGGEGPPRVARIADAAAGGQILLTDGVRALLGNAPPSGSSIRDLGWYRLRGFDALEHLFQLDVVGLPVDHPPLRGVIADADHLPIELTRFVGRHRDLERLDRLIGTTRLLTITGPGGTGKTRLAIEAARRTLDRFPDGAWFVDLSTVTDPSQVLPAIARGVGLFDGPTGPAVDRLADHLAGRTLLLVLDNLEQVVDAAIDVAGLLEVGPSVVILATSRVPLGVAAEQIVPLRPLDIDPTGHPDALELFLDRLARARPDLEVDDRARAIAMDICRAVDGLPLGIELAAARARSLPLTAIRDRLVARMPLPGSGPRDLPARQQTLQRTIDWSLGLLPATVSDGFGRLGVFEGSFAFEQVDALETRLGGAGADALEIMSVLADHSLIGPVDDVHEPRYEMLETIRAASVATLVAGGAGRTEDDVRAAHAAVFCQLAERAAADWGTRRQAGSLARLGRDQANLRAAIGWAIRAGETELARRLSGSLWRYWLMHGGLQEGRALADAVLAMPPNGATDETLLGALDAAGGLAYWAADPVAADAAYRRQLDTAQAIGAPGAIADAAFNLVHTRFILEDETARIESLAIARRGYEAMGDARGLLRHDFSLAVAESPQQPPEMAQARMLTLLDRARRIEDLPYVALTAGSVALAAMMAGDVASALRYGILGVRVNRLLADRPSTVLALLPSSFVATILDRPVEAACLYGAFDAMSRLHGFGPPAALAQFSVAGDPTERAREALGDEGYAAAVARGRAMTIEEAVEVVEELGRATGVDIPEP